MSKGKHSKQIDLGFDPHTGKRVRKRIYSDTKAGLKQAEKEAIAEFARDGTPSMITYREYEQKWLEAYHGNVTPHSMEVNRSNLKHSTPLHGKKMKDITKTDLQKIVSGLSDRPAACAKYVGLMSGLWKAAVADGICTKDITLGIKPVKARKTTRRPLTKEELAGVKKAEFSDSEQFLVDILLQFGLRPGEAFALNKNSFSRKDRTLVIDKAVAYDGIAPYIKDTKTGATRTLPVPDNFWDKIPKARTLYFFVGDTGELLTLSERITMQDRILSKINLAMGGNSKLKLTDITLYNFRHHKASLLYYLPGVSLKKKAEYMGHSEEMFLKTYSHMMEDKEDVEALREAVSL